MRVTPTPGDNGPKVLPPSDVTVTPSGEPVKRPPGGALHTTFIVAVVADPFVASNSVVISKVPDAT